MVNEKAEETKREEWRMRVEYGTRKTENELGSRLRRIIEH